MFCIRNKLQEEQVDRWECTDVKVGGITYSDVTDVVWG